MVCSERQEVYVQLLYCPTEILAVYTLHSVMKCIFEFQHCLSLLFSVSHTPGCYVIRQPIVNGINTLEQQKICHLL